MFEKSCQCQVHRTWYRLHASSPEAEVSTYSTEFDGSQDFSNTLSGSSRHAAATAATSSQVNPTKPGATDIVTNDSVFDVALASITQQRVKLNPFCVEDQADLLQDIKLLAKEENL